METTTYKISDIGEVVGGGTPLLLIATFGAEIFHGFLRKI